MVRQDILAGLRNAVERCYSIEQARNTLINSGYNLNEVNEAVAYMTGGLAGVGQQQQIQPQQTQNIKPIQPQNSAQQTQTEEKPKKKFPWMVVLLSTFLIALVIVLILVLIFKDQVTELLQKLF